MLSADEWRETALSVTVVDASKVWPGGLSPDDIKERVLVVVKTDLEVEFHGDGGDALAKKDNLAGLLKLAASRL